jgi:hypothetical protein
MPQRTLDLLEHLEALGFSNDHLSLLHEYGRITIRELRAYCSKYRSFRPKGVNARLRERLETVWRRLRQGDYPHLAVPGVFQALCEDVARQIPM